MELEKAAFLVLALEVLVLVALLLLELFDVVEAGALVAVVILPLVVEAGCAVVTGGVVDDEGSYMTLEASADASEMTEVASSAAPPPIQNPSKASTANCKSSPSQS